jgi:predicted esterase YcpF (UPF0227 family)
MQRNKTWFYFNGFNSAILEDYSGNAKIVAVAEWAERLGYRFRPISVGYRRARQHCRDVLIEARGVLGSAVFSGSSMGGWFARIVQLQLHATRPALPTAAIAFNPAYDLAAHAHLLVGPQVNHVTGESYEWTRSHSLELAGLEGDVDYDLRLPFYVYVDRGDEVIDWRGSEERHRPIARFRAYEGGCHSFDHYREALAHFAADFGE